MRIVEEIADIDYKDTKHFFKNRAAKFNESNPYSVTMYQDNNQKLVEDRNRVEVEKICPLLKLDSASKVLDVACGIGRWADAMPDDIGEYCGVDFSEELIQIANERNNSEKKTFLVGSATNIEEVLKVNGKEKFNRVLIVGILMYLNDEDVKEMLRQVESVCEEHAIICVREPIGIEKRLTLKNFYSDELADDYNAIYRTRAELKDFFDRTLLEKGFKIKKQRFLFKGKLNNRKETSQYYYIFER